MNNEHLKTVLELAELYRNTYVAQEETFNPADTDPELQAKIAKWDKAIKHVAEEVGNG